MPGFSSVHFGLTIETELINLDEIDTEATRAYDLLRETVDRELLNPGFVPPADYGMDDSQSSDTNSASQNGGRWQCSDKQKELIRKIVDEQKLDRNEVDHLARQRFGKGVRQLNKMEASGLIDELLDTHGNGQRRTNGRRSAYAGTNGKGGHS